MEDRMQTISGEVTDVFAHRFVVKTSVGRRLADLGPRGADRVTLREGDRVELSGEQKPSELKVSRISLNGGQAIVIGQEMPHAHADGDAERAIAEVEAKGFTVLGGPLRKPKHFEVLARDTSGGLVELHLELNGAIRKSRPAGPEDPKWSSQAETIT
jgi:hypothetical protein